MPLPVSPVDAFYSRQQLIEATGLPLELVAYWIKEGLLFAEDGVGRGRGNARQFCFAALQIGAVLAELHRYGLNAKGLKGVASTLWHVNAFGRSHPDVTEEDALDCEMLLKARNRLPSRTEVSTADSESCEDGRENFEDWLESRTAEEAISAKALQMAPWFDRSSSLAFQMYFDLFTKKALERSDSGLFVIPPGDFDMGVLPKGNGMLPDLAHLPSFLQLNIHAVMSRVWKLN